MFSQRLKIGTALCAVLLSTSTVAANLPTAQSEPAPRAADKDSPEDIDDFDATQADVDRLLNTPVPQDVDQLIDRLELISRTAATNSDAVEELKEKIAEERKAVDAAHKSVDMANARMAATAERATESENSMSEISRAAYRGANVDPVSAIAGASGPAAAMDRSAYLAALAQDASAQVDAVTRDMRSAQSARSDAQRAKAQADFRMGELKAEQKRLDERTKILDKLKDEVKSTVDGFSDEDRKRWVDRNGPIDIDVKDFLGSLKANPSDSGSDYTGAVAAAMSKLGAPYGWGAAGPGTFDCSGLMVWSYKQVGKDIPRTSQAQLAGGTPVSMDELQPGDLVAYYPGATHIGMYIGDGKLVHASDYGIPVQVVPVDSMPTVGAVRF